MILKYLVSILAALALIAIAQAQTIVPVPPQACTAVITCQGTQVTIPATTPVPTPIPDPPPVVTPPPTVTSGGLQITAQGARSVSLAWPAVTGAVSYKVYRNGVAYASSTGTAYTDPNATNATNSSYNTPATIYSYAVSALDAAGKESAKTSGATYWVLANGVMQWQQYSYGLNTKVDAGGLLVTTTGPGSGFQPYASGNVPIYDLEAGSFTRMRLDVQVTRADQTFNISFHSRVPQPPGDVYSTQMLKLEKYCAFIVGQKVTCYLPLADFHIGRTNLTGSISGNTLTVTAADQSLIDAGGFVTGPGVKPGTWIQDASPSGGPGTYTVQPAQTAASGPMTYQRTHLYKFDLMDQSGAASNSYRLDNIGFMN